MQVAAPRDTARFLRRRMKENRAPLCNAGARRITTITAPVRKGIDRSPPRRFLAPREHRAAAPQAFARAVNKKSRLRRFGSLPKHRGRFLFSFKDKRGAAEIFLCRLAAAGTKGTLGGRIFRPVSGLADLRFCGRASAGEKAAFLCCGTAKGFYQRLKNGAAAQGQPAAGRRRRRLIAGNKRRPPSAAAACRRRVSLGRKRRAQTRRKPRAETFA